jgi:hypothetical protein
MRSNKPTRVAFVALCVLLAVIVGLVVWQGYGAVAEYFRFTELHKDD